MDRNERTPVLIVWHATHREGQRQFGTILSPDPDDARESADAFVRGGGELITVIDMSDVDDPELAGEV